VGKYEKIISKILKGKSDKNISFLSLRQLLLHLGFDERIKGSHHIFRKAGVEAKVNLQQERNKAKPYQVRQIRELILKYRFGGQDE
jgi:predicted RNA binding protein YcfA (HicA-like mRNA interferase family)